MATNQPKKTWLVRAWFWGLGLIAGLFGCNQPRAKLNGTATYAQHGVSFKYLSHWAIDAEAHPEGFTYIDANTGGSAVFLVLVKNESDATSLQEHATHMSETEALLTAHVTGMKVSSVQVDPADNNQAIQKMLLTVLGVTVPHQIEYRRLASSDAQNKRVAFLKWQTPVDDADKTALGAALIFDTFRFTQ